MDILIFEVEFLSLLFCSNENATITRNRSSTFSRFTPKIDCQRIWYLDRFHCLLSKADDNPTNSFVSIGLNRRTILVLVLCLSEKFNLMTGVYDELLNEWMMLNVELFSHTAFLE